MISAVLLRGELIDKFREHLLDFKYYRVIHQGLRNIDCKSQSFTKEEADTIVDNFINSGYPLVCRAGTKSTISFFDYHIVLKKSEKEKVQ